MKEVLAAMHRANIRRARFHCHVDAINERGAIGAVDITGPVGDPIPHGWINPGEWNGPLPQKGQVFDVLADIRQYFKGSGIEDFGLFHVRVL